MGVSGCGKSSLAQALAQACALPWIEGDDFHSPESRAKMSQGIALTDADRAGWLDTLGAALQRHADGAVLACSALKRAYRERLRARAPGLRFVFLEIAKPEALRRVQARAATHFFSATLVDDQFATLEPPRDEAGVLTVDATLPLAHLQQQVAQWLQHAVQA